MPAPALPPGVVTVTLTVPVPGGLVTVICVPESAVIVPAAPPKLTPVAPPRLVPLIVTAVPPAVVPLDGDTAVVTGGGVTWVNLPALALPPGVVTVTLTV